MASISNMVKNLFLREVEYVNRPGQLYDDAVGGYVIFVIHGGLVLIKSLVGVADTVIAAACQLDFTVDGVAIAATAAITSGIGDVIPIPLDASGVDVLIPNIACQPNPTLVANLAEGSHAGLIAGPGDIVATATIAPMGAAELLSFKLQYRRIDPWASISIT